jgi:O-antigen/teichoic acid export membrane protein
LRRLVVSGAGWMMGSQAATQLLALVTSIVIARFLTPREVGLAAMGIVFSALALVLADVGLGSALVQRQDLSEDDKSTAFWFSIAMGVVLTGVGIGLSWPIASLYGEPRVQRLFAALSFMFVFTAPGIVQGALLTRELRFRALELRTIAATTASAATGITLAVLGAGPWAIVAQLLTITSVSTLLLWRSSAWRPSARISGESIRRLAGFSSHVVGTRLSAWGARNLDNLLVGRYLGAASLGAYSIAYSLMVTPVNRIAGPLTQVFYPAFSRMRDRESIGAVWLRAVRMVALVVVPLMLGLAAVAPDFVRVVFGKRWHAAAPVLQIIALVGLAQSLQALNYGILQSLARTRVLFRYTALASLATVGAFAAGLPWGIKGVATAYLLASVVLEPIYLWLTARAAGVPVRDWLRSIAGVAQAGLAMVVVVVGVRRALLATSLTAGPRLALLIAVGAAVYLPLAAWRAPETRHELQSLRKRRRGATPVTADR